KKATFKDNSISINVKITSSLLDTIDEKCLSAFIYNDNENKEIQIRKKDERLYEIKIPTEIIPTTNHSSLNKIKLIYQDGDLYNEKVLSEPGANSKATTVNKKTEKWSYKLDYTFSWELYISKENITNVFDNLDIQDNNLIIKAAHIDPNSQFKLKNFREKPIIGEVHGDEIVFNLNDFEAIHRLFELEVSNNGVQTRNFKFSKIPFYSSQIKQDETHEYVIRVYNNHSFTLNRKGRHSNVLEMRKNNRDLLIRFESPYDLDVSLSKVFLSLKSTNGKVVKKFPADIIDKNTCQVAIPLETDNINYFVTYGEFVFSVDYYLNNKLLPSSLLLNASRKVKFPFSFTYKNRKYDFSSKNGNLIYLYKKQIWDKVDNTRQKRKRNYKYLYPLFRLLPKNKKKVIYYSYWGDQYSCSPKAVYETLEKKYPKYKNIWIMNDVNLPIKGNGQVVKKNSLKYWFHLATAKYFIQNTNMPVDYKKRRGQKEVQTFHGTFMKTMGFDTPEFKFETRQNKIDQFQKKINNWDYVSVPSDYMTSKARSAFNTNVKSIPSGFPRNDMIFDALNHTESIKKSLNIPSNKKIILYAPTWREGKSSDIKLDIENMQKQLGNDFILLVRAHYMVSNNMDIRQYYPFAINVSNYPSIEELYAISDVLITDYSSVMFDYAYLKRPMLFYAYDLEKYLYSERGTYLDYEKIVPGPVIRNTDALIDELQNLNSLNSRYKDKYQQFYDEFCQYGRDGDASETVIKTLFK
ncbi:CDP-glycerol glycerophosphotransferase family protein, partial [Staphylococcus piscifermentans]